MRAEVSAPEGALGLLPPSGGALWWRRGAGFIGLGEAARVEVTTGEGRIERAAAQVTGVFDELSGDARGPVAIGSFTFDPEAAGSLLYVPDVVHHLGGEAMVTWSRPGAETPRSASERFPVRPRFAGASLNEIRWMEAVADAVAAIERGELEKVVLARDELLRAPAPFDEGLVAAKLAAAFPECYTFACGGLVGATPELLVSKRGGRVSSLVLAGSARRHSDPEADRAAGEALRSSDKERDEHRLAVESVSASLRGVCEEVVVEPEPHLLRLANVQHLATNVTARVDPATSVLHLVAALHPTAAVGGVPKTLAMERIRTAEGDLRGRYAGPVGWVDARGDGEWGIALRCAAIDGGTARLFAGAGIVAGSLPEAELEETRLKLRAMQGALGLQL